MKEEREIGCKTEESLLTSTQNSTSVPPPPPLLFLICFPEKLC